uniref:Glycosyltransferase 2-like domain-containing protein n=1 Tax=viral metagenome TaxID=1070528 RepID=A0A6C0JGV4_9ZZZZ
MKNTISVAIPYYNSSHFILDALHPLLNDNRISEIIICDDKSSDIDIQLLQNKITSLNNPKITVYFNEENLGCFKNKLKVLSYCSNDWAILLDADNIINTDYIDRLYLIDTWNPKYIYAPQIAFTFPGYPSPHLDYSEYANKVISKQVYLRDFKKNTFQCLINTCNYFVPVKEYLKNMETISNLYNRPYMDSLDSAVLFTEWLTENEVFVVNNLFYKHRLHDESNYSMSKSKNSENIVKNYLYYKIYLCLDH